MDDPHFSLFERRVSTTADLANGPKAARIVFVLNGQGEIAGGQAMQMGSCWLVPAELETCPVQATDSNLVLLEAIAAPHQD